MWLAPAVVAVPQRPEASALQAPDPRWLLANPRWAVLLASDHKNSRRCLDTATSIRKVNYSGPLIYATEPVKVDPKDIAALRAPNMRVRVMGLRELLHEANPSSRDGDLVARVPKRCNFRAITDRLRIPDTNKRAQGWTGYWYKTLAMATSYWRGRFDKVLYIDCGATALDSPFSDIFEKIDTTGRLLAERDSDDFTEPAFTNLKLGNQFIPSCNETAHAALLHERGGPSNFSVEYFNSAFMLYDTAILGRANSALREIADLYHGPAGALTVGDQGLLNLYWGPLTRNVWAPLPRQRHATRGPDCFYDYFQRPIKGCKSYLLVKQTSAPATPAAQHAAPGLFANMGWRQVSQDKADDDGDDEVLGEVPTAIDHTCALSRSTAQRHHSWKKGVKSLLERLAAAAGTDRIASRVSIAARVGAEALQQSRASHAGTEQVDVLSTQVEAIDA